MPISNDDIELNIGAAARVARQSHDYIHQAMVTGALAHHRDHDGRRVVKLGDLLEWMRRQPTPAPASE